MKSYLLRDLKRNTELLILTELMRNPSIRRRDLADRLGVTEQAISQYMSQLEQKRLISSNHGNQKPTKKGVQILQERLFGLRDEIDTILRQIQVIDTCLAIASTPIKIKEPVGLIMKDGNLWAVPGISSGSKGIARTDADAGEEVLVGNLEGVVELELGELLAIQLPSETAGGSRKADFDCAREAIGKFRYDEICAGDLIGIVVAKKLDLKPSLKFAPIRDSLNALFKGLNVLFLGTRDSVIEMFNAIEDFESETGNKIEHTSIDIAPRR